MFRREELPGRFTAKNYQEGLQQRSYLDGQIRDTMKNIGEG